MRAAERRSFLRSSVGESRILGALSKLDEFPLKPQIRVQSGTVSRLSRKTNRENQELNEDRSQIYPRPEADTSIDQSPQSKNSDPDEASHSNRLETLEFGDSILDMVSAN